MEDVVCCLHYFLKKKKSITTGARLNLIKINAFELRVTNELCGQGQVQVVRLLPLQITPISPDAVHATNVTCITNLETFLLWLLQSLEICCLFGLPVLQSEVQKVVWYSDQKLRL